MFQSNEANRITFNGINRLIQAKILCAGFKTSMDCIGLKHVAIIDFRYQLQFHSALKNITTWEWLIFFDQKLFEDDISIIFDRFSSIKCLSITKNLAKAKHLVVGKLLADGKLFSVGKHLVDTKHLASIKMLTDLTYLTIDEKLECKISFTSKAKHP